MLQSDGDCLSQFAKWTWNIAACQWRLVFTFWKQRFVDCVLTPDQIKNMNALLKRSLAVSEIVHRRQNCYNLKQEEGIKPERQWETLLLFRNKRVLHFQSPEWLTSMDYIVQKWSRLGKNEHLNFTKRSNIFCQVLLDEGYLNIVSWGPV